MASTLVEIPCDVLLLGPVSEAQHTRMGVRLVDLSATMKDHKARVYARTCIEPGCKNDIQVRRQHGWTCVTHDVVDVAIAKKRARNAVVK